MVPRCVCGEGRGSIRDEAGDERSRVPSCCHQITGQMTRFILSSENKREFKGKLVTSKICPETRLFLVYVVVFVDVFPQGLCER